ncbi:MAG TPA: metalloregulator ArsR/SmtB family transcription factor [Epsilonproteobacteria bacterium]|nr:metalloregulator ArsR/SmtB family transcription factor [Campylobacterota bacterium]
MVNFTACRRSSVDTLMIESAQDMLEAVEIELAEKVKLFALLGNEVRLKTVLLLLNVECLCVCDIADILKMNQSPISQHLRKLRDAGILENTREGMTIYYAVANEKRTLLLSIVKGANNDR